MTVSVIGSASNPKLGQGTIFCHWFDGEQKLGEGAFPVECVERASIEQEKLPS